MPVLFDRCGYLEYNVLDFIFVGLLTNFIAFIFSKVMFLTFAFLALYNLIVTCWKRNQ